MESTALVELGEKGMLARIEKAKFPQALSKEDKALLATVALDYGLDPLMGELGIYQGHPYVSIDGRYRKAHETGQLDGVSTRPATQEERVAWQIQDGDYFFRAEVWKKDCRMPFVGWGRVLLSETQGGKGFKPVETNPQRMAEKRAEAQALRKAFHLPLPSAEGGNVAEGEYRDLGDAPEASEPPESPAETAPGSTPAEVIHHPEPPKATEPQNRGSVDTETAQDIADLRVLVKEALAERWPNDRERRNEAAFCRAFGMVSTVEEIPPHMLREALEMAPGPRQGHRSPSKGSPLKEEAWLQT